MRSDIRSLADMDLGAVLTRFSLLCMALSAKADVTGNVTASRNSLAE
jgi:hypothetical protein